MNYRSIVTALVIGAVAVSVAGAQQGTGDKKPAAATQAGTPAAKPDSASKKKMATKKSAKHKADAKKDSTAKAKKG